MAVLMALDYLSALYVAVGTSVLRWAGWATVTYGGKTLRA